MKTTIVLDVRNQAVIEGTNISIERLIAELANENTVTTVCNKLHLSGAQVKSALDYVTSRLPQPSADEVDYELLAGAASYFDYCPEELPAINYDYRTHHTFGGSSN